MNENSIKFEFCEISASFPCTQKKNAFREHEYWRGEILSLLLNFLLENLLENCDDYTTDFAH